MDKEKIIEVLSSWNFWKKDHEVGIIRSGYLKRIDKLIATGQIVALTGVRRSGKSTLIKQFIKGKIDLGEKRTSFLYVNFEEPYFMDSLSLQLLQEIYTAYIEIVKPENKPYLLLDEIQNIPKWEKFVRSLHEKGEAHILTSGSTSKLLSKEFGALLTGRWLELKVYPLNFSEFLQFKGIKAETKLDILTQKNKIRQLLREFLEFGGFPLVVLKEEKEDLLKRYFDDIITRDIVERYKIKKIDRLRALAKYYLTNFASPISYRRIAKFIGLSLSSIERFSMYLEQSYLVSPIPKFSYSLKEQEVNPRVVYGIDLGLLNMISFRFSDNIGKLYENIVFLDLLRGGKNIYYYKGKNECDFVIKAGQQITDAIQVSYTIKENKERELKGLLECMTTFRLKKGLIITDDFETKERITGKTVQYIPLWKWLLLEKR